MFLNALTRVLALSGTFAAHPLARAQHPHTYDAGPPAGDCEGMINQVPRSVLKNIDTVADMPSQSHGPASQCLTFDWALPSSNVLTHQSIHAALRDPSPEILIDQANRIRFPATAADERGTGDGTESAHPATPNPQALREQIQRLRALDSQALEEVPAKTIETQAAGRPMARDYNLCLSGSNNGTLPLVRAVIPMPHRAAPDFAQMLITHMEYGCSSTL